MGLRVCMITPFAWSQPHPVNDHVAGAADAPYELVMYGDFQCPYCVAAQAMVRRARERLDGEPGLAALTHMVIDRQS